MSTPAAETWFLDLLVDLNGILWAVGGASTPNPDNDAVVAVVDGSGTLLDSVGVDGWLGFGFSAGTVDTNDSFFAAFATSATQRTFIGWNGSSVDRPFAVRVDAGNGSVDPGFGSGGIATWASTGFFDVFDATQDRLGRLILGGALDGSGESQALIARYRNDEIFADGFERGDTGGWSATTP